jgi:diguanylate cyclase (GGDEF)-like protein
MSDGASTNRVWFYLSLAALIALSAGISDISVRDPDAAVLRFGMILLTAGVAIWLPLPAVILAVPAIWFGPNYMRGQVGGGGMFQTETLLELPGLIALALVVTLTRRQLRVMEEESQVVNGFVSLQSEIDEETGVYQERLLKESIERELVRSRRFGREFAIMLADVDSMRAKFDYREDEKWDVGFKATAGVLLNTRTHIDRVYRFGEHAFALLLPETGSKDITGLVRRLSRAAKRMSPPEGEPGGPLPLHFGVTFFPQCATTADDLLRRAEVALRLAEKNPNHVQLDGAEAPDMPAPESLRREDEGEVYVDSLAGKWLGAEAPEEEQPRIWLQAAGQSAVATEADASVMPAEPLVQLAEPTVAESMPQGVTSMADASQDGGALAGPSVHDEAEAVAAQTWVATESAGGTTATEPDAARVEASQRPGPLSDEQAAVVGHSHSPAEAAQPDPFAEMLKRMDETLAMIRKLKSGAKS